MSSIFRTMNRAAAQGVSVAALGTEEFPAFFTPHSGCVAPARVDGPQQAARMIHASKQYCLNSGVLIGISLPCLRHTHLGWNEHTKNLKK